MIYTAAAAPTTYNPTYPEDLTLPIIFELTKPEEVLTSAGTTPCDELSQSSFGHQLCLVQPMVSSIRSPQYLFGRLLLTTGPGCTTSTSSPKWFHKL